MKKEHRLIGYRHQKGHGDQGNIDQANQEWYSWVFSTDEQRCPSVSWVPNVGYAHIACLTSLVIAYRSTTAATGYIIEYNNSDFVMQGENGSNYVTNGYMMSIT